MRFVSLPISGPGGLIVLGLSVMLAGCSQPEAGNDATSKAPPASPPTATLPQISESGPAAPVPPPPGGAGQSLPQAAAEGRKAAANYVGLDENGIDIGLIKINEALKQFIQDTERLPKDLRELVTSGAMARLPTPPSGKKYAIDPASKTVVIVSQ